MFKFFQINKEKESTPGFTPTSKSLVRGFTLIELVIYTAIFGTVAGLLTTILITSTKIESNQVVSTQVSSELNLVLTTVQSQVRSSSNIECVSNTNCSLSSGPYLKLRFEDPTLDPTCIYLQGTQILMAQGPDATNKQNCTSTTQALTTSKVSANTLTFTKFDIPGGHATVQIDATLTYNSTNPDQQISRTLRSAIGRVSAATFDSDLLPDATNSRNIGTLTGAPKAWKNIFLTGVLGLGSYTDAQETGVTTATGGLYYNTTTNRLKAYTGTAWQFVSQWITTGANIYFNTGNVGVGNTSPGELLSLGTAGTTKGVLSLSGNTSGKIIIQPAAIAGSYTLTLPNAQGGASTSLQNDGLGNLSWASGGSPAGAVSFFNLAACPVGWTELTAARGRYIVGLPLAGTLAGTAGTALSNLEDRPVGQHSHGLQNVSNSAPWNWNGAWELGQNSGSSGSTDAAGSVAGTNAPYVQLLVCQKS
ncbi:MAG: prepilin-type N-terminal cleavage/methylation domain-containing protein [Patescibacteria group bacterium]